MSEKPVISIAGTGNVAFHLGSALSESYQLKKLLGRNTAKGEELARKLNTDFTTSEDDLSGSDLIICCYSDDAIKDALPKLSQIAPVVSTSGTVDVLRFDHQHEIGVFYPLQSFSGSDSITLENLPVFIEASADHLRKLLIEIAKQIGSKPVEMTAEERLKLHVTAVFTNNFTNHIIDIAQQFALENGINFEYLLPLLDKTIEKIHRQPASENQTGPAKRNDRQTIVKHLAMLDDDKKRIYQLLSESIIRQNS